MPAPGACRWIAPLLLGLLTALAVGCSRDPDPDPAPAGLAPAPPAAGVAATTELADLGRAVFFDTALGSRRQRASSKQARHHPFDDRDY